MKIAPKFYVGIIFLLSSFSTVKSDNPGSNTEGPVLSVGDEVIVNLNVSNSLEITCEGHQPLAWKTPIPGEYGAIYNLVPNENYQYRSRYYVQEIFSEDTGYFNCSYESNNLTVSSYIYFYLPGDSIFKNLNHGIISVFARPDEEIVLPCLVTHPNATVNVTKDAYKLDPHEYDFDPRTGVTIFTSSSQPQPYGLFMCVNAQNSSDVLTMQVRYGGQIKLEPPHISQHKNGYPVVGEPFSLNCTTFSHIENSVLVWQVESFPVEVSEQFITEHLGLRMLTKTITIPSPSLRDSGIFTCVVIVRAFTAESSIEIEFEEYKEPFISFESSNSTLVVKEELFIWASTVLAYPNIEYTFYDPYNNVINATERFSSSLDYQSGSLVLKINPLIAEDFGLYKVVAWVPSTQLTDTRYAKIIVNAPPKIRQNSFAKIYSIGETITANCHILSYDFHSAPPQVTWGLDYCPGNSSCKSDIDLIDDLERDDGPENRWIATASFTAEKSGSIGCTAKNSNGTSTSSETYFVSDFGNLYSFVIESELGSVDGTLKSSATVIEGDNITVSCRGIKYLYLNVHLKGSSLTSLDCGTEISHGSCIYVEYVSRNFSEEFTCIGDKEIGTERYTNRIVVSAIESKEPILLQNSNVSLEQTEMEITMGSSFRIACLVDGRPKPTIIWLKDKEELDFRSEDIQLKNDGEILKFPYAKFEHSGIYECIAKNRLSFIRPSASVEVKGRGLPIWGWIVVVFVLIGISFLIFLSIHLNVKYKKERKLKMELRKNQLYLFQHGNVVDISPEMTADEQAELLPYDHTFEIPREKIKLGKVLGHGAFGVVKIAKVDDLEEEGKKSLAAVKMCKDVSDTSQLRSLTIELKIMIHIGKHLNIVNLLGAYTANIIHGELWILVEYCKYGNLLQFIRRNKDRFVCQINPDNGDIDYEKGYDVFDMRFSFSENGGIRSRKRKSTGSEPFQTSSVKKPDQQIIIDNPSYDTVPQPRNVDPEYEHYKSPRKSTFSESDLPVENTTETFVLSNSGGYIRSSDFMSKISNTRSLSPDSFNEGESFSTGPSSQDDNIPGVSAPFTTSTLILWAWQVASGMQYLADRKVLHADLAARNLLLAHNNIVKISDFGLSRDMYKKDIYCKKSNDLLPVKWMSLEAIKERLFSTQSDVWAYGVTIWEIFTLGNSPYPGVAVDNNFITLLENGLRLDHPKFANKYLYEIMRTCWKVVPKERPSFAAIASKLQTLLHSETCENYLSMNRMYQEKNEKFFEGKVNYIPMMCSPDIENIQNANTAIQAEADIIKSNPFCDNFTQNLNTLSPPQNVNDQMFGFPLVEVGNLDTNYVKVSDLKDIPKRQSDPETHNYLSAKKSDYVKLKPASSNDSSPKNKSKNLRNSGETQENVEYENLLDSTVEKNGGKDNSNSSSNLSSNLNYINVA